ncbi:hypothetical protein ONZ45_g5484 [Pleurotus djamor]|nr:hypothetical protein ONZ45_g5484 [Pleurotus djamor]
MRESATLLDQYYTTTLTPPPRSFDYSGRRCIAEPLAPMDWLYSSFVYPCAGSRVFFWGSNSQVVYGTVQSTSVQADGALVLVIKDDSGKTLNLPAGGVTKVN